MLRTTKGLFFWASAEGGRLLKGTSDGAAWSVIPAPDARPVSPIELPGGAIATLGKNGIMVSADEGATWKTVAPGLPIPTGDQPKTAPVASRCKSATCRSVTWKDTCTGLLQEGVLEE